MTHAAASPSWGSTRIPHGRGTRTYRDSEHQRHPTIVVRTRRTDPVALRAANKGQYTNMFVLRGCGRVAEMDCFTRNDEMDCFTRNALLVARLTMTQCIPYYWHGWRRKLRSSLLTLSHEKLKNIGLNRRGNFMCLAIRSATSYMIFMWHFMYA